MPRKSKVRRARKNTMANRNKSRRTNKSRKRINTKSKAGAKVVSTDIGDHYKTKAIERVTDMGQPDYNSSRKKQGRDRQVRDERVRMLSLRKPIKGALSYDDKATMNMIASAAKKKTIEVADLIREEKADPNGVDPEGNTAMHHAVVFNDIYMMDILLEASASLELANVDGFTPLMSAAFRGSTEAVQWLLKNGVKWLTTDKEGRTALNFAEYAMTTTMEERTASSCTVDALTATVEALTAWQSLTPAERNERTEQRR